MRMHFVSTEITNLKATFLKDGGCNEDGVQSLQNVRKPRVTSMENFERTLFTRYRNMIPGRCRTSHNTPWVKD